MARRDRSGMVAVVAACVALVMGCADDASTARSTSDTRPPTTAAPTTAPATGAAPTTVPAGIPADWQPAPLQWQDCPEVPGGQCATLTVPLDWSVPDGPRIDLALGRLPARGGSGERVGSLVTNPGGPGGSGLEFLSYEPFSAAVSRRFDVVSWDPRGVGASTAVDCDDGVARFLAEDSAPDSTSEQARLDAAARAVSRACGAEDGKLLPHVGTLDVARDLEAIRRALGDGGLNYVGFSYGTQIGQAYAGLYPTEIRTMVLDGVVDPASSYTDFLLGQVQGFEASFRRNVAACARAGRSRCGVDDLAAAYDEVARRVESEPLHTAAGPVGPSELATAAAYTAYGSDGWRELGPALADGLGGDGAALRALADGYYSLGAYGSYAAVVCIDTPPPNGPEAYRAFADRARALSPRFGGSIANELLPCATWPAPPVAAPAGVVAAGAPPILVIGNSGDPATPLANAVAVADRLASGVLVTTDLDGHTAYGSDACVTKVVDRYLVDLTVPPDPTAC